MDEFWLVAEQNTKKQLVQLEIFPQQRAKLETFPVVNLFLRFLLS